MPAGRVDIQDFMVVCPGRASFAEALDWTAEVYRAAGRLMAEAGKLKGVADEGGCWPEFETNEAALEMLVAGDRAGGLPPGEQVRSRSTSPRRSSGAAAATGWASRDASWIPTA